MEISSPNTDALLDPVFASKEAHRCYAPQLILVGEMRDYLKDLIKRILPVCGQSVEDTVLIAGLTRQALVALDGISVCLDAGAVHAGHSQTRSLWEASLFVEWVLSKGKQRWGRQFYVADLRRERQSCRRWMRGNEEYDAFVQIMTDAYGTAPSLSGKKVDAARLRSEQITDHLKRPTFASINSRFDAWVSKHKREPEWWFKPGGPSSIHAMSEKLGRRAEFITIYRLWSGYVHGTRHEAHFTLSDGRIELEPIRYVPQLPMLLGPALPVAVRLIRTVTEAYRPGELPQLAKTYKERWRPRFEIPEVDVTIEVDRFL